MGALYSSTRNSELKRSNVKLQAQQVSAFNGSAIKWRTWKKRTRAAIGTAGLLEILDSADYASKNKVDNETVFHLLQVATADGNAAHLVDAHEDNKDGHAAYVDLVTWYEGDELTTETAEDIRSKLDKLVLNTRTSASEYINYFQLYTKQLADLGESYTQSKTVQMFLAGITDPDYDTTREFCVENKSKIDECIERIQGKERRLTRLGSIHRPRQMNVRRNVASGDHGLDKLSGHVNKNRYYSIPSETWNSLSPKTQEEVKKFNGNLRKSRRSLGNNSNQDANQESNINQRRSMSSEVGDKNPSPFKKLRTVQFKDDEDQVHEEVKESNGKKDINQRRNDVLTFQVAKK